MGRAMLQRVPGVRMESLRADSVFSRGYPETTCARGGALQGRCERVFRAGTGRMPACGVRWRCSRRVRATEPIPGSPCLRGTAGSAAWELTHPGGAEGAVAGP